MKTEKSYSWKNLDVLALKAKILGLQELSKTIHASLVSKTGVDRERERNIKRVLGEVTRNHLIAYALLRGKSYSTLERKCNKGNEPNPKKIFDIIMQQSYGCYGWSLDKVKQELSK